MGSYRPDTESPSSSLSLLPLLSIITSLTECYGDLTAFLWKLRALIKSQTRRISDFTRDVTVLSSRALLCWSVESAVVRCRGLMLSLWSVTSTHCDPSARQDSADSSTVMDGCVCVCVCVKEMVCVCLCVWHLSHLQRCWQQDNDGFGYVIVCVCGIG